MSDLASRIIDEILTGLAIDDQWVRRQDDRFTWVADKLEQSYRVTLPFTFLGEETVAIVSRIPVLRNVSRPSHQVCGLLSQFNHAAVGSAYVFDAESREVFSLLRVMVSEENLEERCWIARTFGMIQLIMAEHQAPHLLEGLTGEPALADPPRPQPDPALNSFMEYMTSRPRSENRFENDAEFKLAMEYAEKIGGVSTDPDHPGRELEFRFSDDATSVATLETGAEHPTFGMGLRSMLALPITYDSNRKASLAANDLNLRDMADPLSGYFLGAWSIDQRTESLAPVYSAFTPNALFAETLTAMTAAQLGVRARACERWHFPDAEFKRSALEIVMDRKGYLFEGKETPQ